MNGRHVDLLIRSFDQHLSQEEQQELEAALKASRRLRAERKALEAMRQQVAESGSGEFRPFFSARVMNRIRASQTATEEFVQSLTWAFRVFAMVGVTAIVLFVSVNSRLGKDISVETIFSLPTLGFDDVLKLDHLTGEERK